MDCSTFAFDLHVLGTPPALILSQDQTLKLNLLSPPEGGGNSFNPISLFNWLSDSSHLRPRLRSGSGGPFKLWVV